MQLFVLVNDTPYGVMGLRARHITTRLPARYRTDIQYREAGKWEELRRFTRHIAIHRPDLIYVMNVGYAGGGAALMARSRYGIPYVLDHGDPSYELLKNSGRPAWEAFLVRAAEWTMLHTADAIVARGARLFEALGQMHPDTVHYLPDGVDTERFKPLDVTDLRRRLNLEGSLTVGVIGSVVWSSRFEICYGWDIVEAMYRLKNKPVKGIVVGDGTGIPFLKERARQYGIEDRILFTGRVPHEEVPQYINLMDVCISTQTNDSVGQGRTTAKLPEYLACGRFVIATEVGGATGMIRENGFLLPYQGIHDPGHPARLAERLGWLLDHPEALGQGLQGVEIAKRHFEYTALANRLAAVFDRIVPGSR
ncbi:MAG: glycosyltransferase [candidate division Zixibacteria bacterium]|nr:glycosyltransferase [candidate division Zixibacteria bacterium]